MPSLVDSLSDMDLLFDAWKHVKSKGGTAGVDGMDSAAFEGDLENQLEQLVADFKNQNYSTQACRSVSIPKTSGGHRIIVIATLRDRVAMHAFAEVAYPLFESLFHPCSYAFRKKIGIYDALNKIVAYRNRGLRHVFHADIFHFFERVDHAILREKLEPILLNDLVSIELIYAWIQAPIINESGSKPNAIGLPQGLPISPLLANYYLTPFDRTLIESGWKLVRYADDFVICTDSRCNAEEARRDATNVLSYLNLELGEDKTGVYSFEEGFSFLGAKFLGDEVLPAFPHPYEADYIPPPPRMRKIEHIPLQYAPVFRTLYIQEQGSKLGCHGERFVVTRSTKTLIDLSYHNVEQIFIFGRVQITAAAMSFCLVHKIPVYLFSGKGSYYGALRTVPGDSVFLRKKQYEASQNLETVRRFAQSIVKGKIQNYKNFLQRYFRNHPIFQSHKYTDEFNRLEARLEEAGSTDSIRGIEGAATSAYYQGLSKIVQTPFYFHGRTRRPPTDPVNGMMSFGYTMLYYNLFSYICARNLDPDLGLFHCIEPGHHSLSSDLVEEFRAPIVDSLVVSICNNRILSPEDFFFGEGVPQPCLMTDGARKTYIHQFEEKMAGTVSHPDSSEPVPWRRCLDLQVMRVRRFIEGTVERYEPYTIR